MAKEYKRECRICGKEFISAGVKAYYCPDCRVVVFKETQRKYRQKHRKALLALHKEYCAKKKAAQPPKPERICKHCGKTFVPIVGRQIFCSRICCRRFHYPADRLGRLTVERTCKICGKTFVPIAGHQKFCSAECRESFQYPSKRKCRGAVEKTCKLCGKTFFTKVHDKKFCSKKCEEAYFSKEYKKCEQLSKPTEKKPLSQWMEEARQCGLSYGIYRMQVERFGKTFEELRRC